MSNIIAKIDDMLISLEDLGSDIQINLDRLDSVQGAERQQLELTIENQISDYQNHIDKVGKNIKILKTSKEYYEHELNKFSIYLSDYSAKLRQKRLINTQGNAQTLKTQQNLQEAINIGHDTLKTADDIKEVLLQDANTIRNIGGNLNNINKLSDKGIEIAERMRRRQICISVVSWLIVILLVGLLGFTIYYKFFKK